MTLGDKMEKELGVQPGRGMMGNGMGYHNGGRHAAVMVVMADTAAVTVPTATT